MSPVPQPAQAPLLRPLIRSATVKASFGGISDMTLWRWIRHRQFPKPRKIAGRNYWDPREVDAWRAESVG